MSFPINQLNHIYAQRPENEQDTPWPGKQGKRSSTEIMKEMRGSLRSNQWVSTIFAGEGVASDVESETKVEEEEGPSAGPGRGGPRYSRRLRKRIRRNI